jgi:hypothetical protein
MRILTNSLLIMAIVTEAATSLWSMKYLIISPNRFQPVSKDSTVYITGLRELNKGKVYPCTGTEALYRPYGP